LSSQLNFVKLLEHCIRSDALIRFQDFVFATNTWEISQTENRAFDLECRTLYEFLTNIA